MLVPSNLLWKITAATRRETVKAANHHPPHSAPPSVTRSYETFRRTWHANLESFVTQECLAGAFYGFQAASLDQGTMDLPAVLQPTHCKGKN